MFKIAAGWLSLLIIFLTIGLVLGQPESTTLDPTTFFVDGVQYEQISVQATDQALYHLNYSQQTIQVRASTTSEWQVFPYPEDMPVIDCATLRTDGLWLIQARCITTKLTAQSSGIHTFRLLNPTTGLYSLPETVCDGQLKASTGEGEWVYVTEQESGRTRLCFTENGEQQGYLPGNVHWDNRYLPKFSPEKTYLLLQAYKSDVAREISTMQFYSYKLADKQLTWLGTANNYNAGILRWLDSNHGVISSSHDYGYPGLELYYFDLTKRKSIKFVLTAFEGKSHNLHFDETSQQYEAILTYRQITSETGSPGEFAPCTLYTIDAVGVASYILGNHCVLLPYRGEFATSDSYTNAYRAANRYYYLAAENEEATISRLMYFDLSEMQIHDGRITAEIDSISSISPDGRYVILEFGEDKRLNNLQHCCTFERYGWAGIYDLEQHKVIYISDPTSNIRSIWLDDKIALIVSDRGSRGIRAAEEGDDVMFIGVPGFRRIQIDEQQGVTTFTSTVFPVDDFRLNGISADGHYMLSEYGIIDLITFEFIPVIKSEITADRFDLYWEGDKLMARIWDQGQEIYYRITLV